MTAQYGNPYSDYAGRLAWSPPEDVAEGDFEVALEVRTGDRFTPEGRVLHVELGVDLGGPLGDVQWGFVNVPLSPSQARDLAQRLTCAAQWVEDHAGGDDQ